MVCEVNIILPDNLSGVLVPGKALQVDMQGRQFVFVHQNGKVEKRTVNTNATLKNHVLVRGNLKSGEEVIVAGQQKLSAGTPVNVIR